MGRQPAAPPPPGSICQLAGPPERFLTGRGMALQQMRGVTPCICLCLSPSGPACPPARPPVTAGHQLMASSHPKLDGATACSGGLSGQCPRASRVSESPLPTTTPPPIYTLAAAAPKTRKQRVCQAGTELPPRPIWLGELWPSPATRPGSQVPETWERFLCSSVTHLASHTSALERVFFGWKDAEQIILSEVSQRETNIV